MQLIKETADGICYTVQQQGQQNDEKVSGEVDAKLSGLAAKFVGIGMKGSGEVRNQEFQGVLREQLASTLKDSAACRLGVFNTLVDRMLPPSTPVGVSKNSGTSDRAPGGDQRQAEQTVSDLCKELDDKSIDFNSNNYHGVVGPTGIKLVEAKLGTFEFKTQVVFPDVPDQSGQPPLRDPIYGVCHDNLITLNRELWNGTTHPHTGHLRKAKTGRTEMQGDFMEGGRSYPWSGWIVNPSQN